MQTAEIALFPHLTQRGPNGIWFLRRGDKHPLVKRANDIHLFCHVDEDGQSIEIHSSSFTGHDGITFDLFSNESKARDQAREDEQEFESTVNIRAVSGKDLLALLAVADALYLDASDIPLTFAGQRLLETERSIDADTILDELAAATAV